MTGATLSSSRRRWYASSRSPAIATDAQALAVLLQGLTAWYLYRTVARIAGGERVVVLAAAGGVGSLARMMGAGASSAWRRPRTARAGA